MEFCPICISTLIRTFKRDIHSGSSRGMKSSVVKIESPRKNNVAGRIAKENCNQEQQSNLQMLTK